MSTLCVCVICVQSLIVCDSWRPHRTVARWGPLPWNFPGKNTGVGCHFLLQGIFLTQGSNLSLVSLALAGGFFTTIVTWETPRLVSYFESTLCSPLYVPTKKPS